MTLMEVTVALAILSLTATLVFSELSPWLARARADGEEAGFWRSVGPTQTLLSELAAAAIDPRTRTIAAHEARFRALAARLAPTPLTITLAVRETGERTQLVLRAAELSERESVLLETPARLRFDASVRGALALEIEQQGHWVPLASASFPANAPLVCAFDPIPRTCRS